MSSFPTSFDQDLHSLPEDSLSFEAKQAIAYLRDKGYEVKSGLTTAIAEEISIMTQEKSIREYCPKDGSERFSNLETTKEWLSKSRAMYVLLYQPAQGEPTLAGYGWVGAKTSDHVSGGQTTFSLRVSEKHQGKGLAAPFSLCMLEAADVEFSAPHMWLETWKSNGGAVHIYHKLGFTDVGESRDTRPSTTGTDVEDVRIYMIRDNPSDTK